MFLTAMSSICKTMRTAGGPKNITSIPKSTASINKALVAMSTAAITMSLTHIPAKMVTITKITPLVTPDITSSRNSRTVPSAFDPKLDTRTRKSTDLKPGNMTADKQIALHRCTIQHSADRLCTNVVLEDTPFSTNLNNLRP